MTYAAPDLGEIHIKLPLNLGTFNAVGTIFGGSIYAACDPWYMIILMRQLGPDYIVSDTSASIHFRKPGRGTLTARFCIEPEEVAEIKRLCETERSINRVYHVDLVNRDGEPAASVEKVLYIRKGDRSQQAQHHISRWINRMMMRV